MRFSLSRYSVLFTYGNRQTKKENRKGRGASNLQFQKIHLNQIGSNFLQQLRSMDKLSNQQFSLLNNPIMFFAEQHRCINENLLEDLKSSAYELSTEVHNSPTTAKFKFLNEEQSFLNCSFDEGGQSGHAQNIWNASVAYIESSLQEETLCQEGLNDQSLYDFSQDNLVLNEKTFDKQILGNGNLTIQQKHLFIDILRNQSELMDLFTQLSSMFNLAVFHEISYLVFKIWEKRHELLESNLESDPLKNYILPRFDCFSNLQNGETILSMPYSSYKQKKTYVQVKQQAQECSQSLGDQMFYDTKVKLLSLRQCKRECKSEDIVRTQFVQFFKILTRSIYLSIEGFFCEFPDGQKIFFNSDVNQEDDSDAGSFCSLDQFMSENNFDERNIGQFDDRENEWKEELSGRKKRKLE